jgi:hypothetical protein
VFNNLRGPTRFSSVAFRLISCNRTQYFLEQICNTPVETPHQRRRTPKKNAVEATSFRVGHFKFSFRNQFKLRTKKFGSPSENEENDNR